ncbi:MAG: O-methyltransferase [Bacilli bacterium]|nr:O-methyltransferase [Bacilli bacterium]MBP3921312.1 O-methyltransferase [Bacilli bacterium]
MVYLRVIEQYAHDNKIPIMLPDGIEFLTNYIKENKIKTILEIGSAIGYSAIKMALVDKDIKITTIERDEKRYKEAIKNINKMELNDQIEILLEDALEFETKKTFDLIFIDAAKAQYIKFFEKYKKNLNQNGTIISDNLEFHGLVKNQDSITNKNTKQLVKKIQNYIIYLKENKEFETKFISIGDGIGISKRSIK